MSGIDRTELKMDGQTARVVEGVESIVQGSRIFIVNRRGEFIHQFNVEEIIESNERGLMVIPEYGGQKGTYASSRILGNGKDEYTFPSPIGTSVGYDIPLHMIQEGRVFKEKGPAGYY